MKYAKLSLPFPPVDRHFSESKGRCLGSNMFGFCFSFKGWQRRDVEWAGKEGRLHTSINEDFYYYPAWILHYIQWKEAEQETPVFLNTAKIHFNLSAVLARKYRGHPLSPPFLSNCTFNPLGDLICPTWKLHTAMFIAVLFTITRRGKQHQQMGVSTAQYMHVMEHQP